MKKVSMLLVALLLCANIFAQKKYEANWESIDSREIPQWYEDAKFGIFIHWGLYSVPAFAKQGQYAEWYWENLVNPKRVRQGHAETLKFHEMMYGKGFTYADFAPMFKCQMFNPDQWAELFEKSGAKYVVLTTKHHDGYCLWPSKEADKSWGRPWNSVATGPMRDLVGDLTNAVRKTSVKMGIYYSLYEWFNPLYTNDVDEYVDKVMIPQFKDVVSKYSPELIFTDGEWGHPHTTWRATEVLSWLYNEAPCKESVVINDRWGKSCRHVHGGYYTTEYGSGLPNSDKVWEENRGMGHSFGYNRAENLADYNSTQELLYMLIDIVSRGGNFLLDVGPTADGRIPVVMQERLLEMGDWMAVNGEAIHGTTYRKTTCQWTEGEARDAVRGRYKVAYDVMKLTVNPDPGMARKEIMFTEKGDALYCICPMYPKDKLVVKNVQGRPCTEITLLGYDKPLKWENKGNDMVIEVPALTPAELPCEHAWTFKVLNWQSVK